MRFIARFLGFLFATGAIVFVGGALAVGALVYIYSKDLPDYTQLKNYEPPVMTRVHAGDGSILAEYSHERRLFLPSNAIPNQVKQAFISAEDKNFYTHHGIDPEGMARAAMVLVQGSKHIQGASTITQQVAKNFLLTNERSFDRKIKEALLSMRIEQTYSKERILELYLNEIYLGLGNYGIAAAALNYFDKSVHELTLAETAYLAGLPKGPNNYNPWRNREAAIARRNYVIERMIENGYVSRADGDAAKAEPLNVNPRALSPNSIAAGYFAEEVRRELNDRYGDKKLYEGGLSVRATLNPTMQMMARKALADGLIRFDEAHGFRGPVKQIDIGADWGQALAQVPALGDVAPWRLAVVLDVNDLSARIGLQPPREKSGEVSRVRETGTHHRRRRPLPAQEVSAGLRAGRRRLCRAARRQAGPVPPPADSGNLRRAGRHGPLYRPRLRHGRRLFLRPVVLQPRDAGAAPAGIILQALRLFGGARQWLYALLDHPRRADRDRPARWLGLAAGKLRVRQLRPAYIALRH